VRFRSVYMESCSMFVRGGGLRLWYAMPWVPFMARLSVSAADFDYILTGPISGVSAGQYLGRLLNEIGEMTHTPVSTSRRTCLPPRSASSSPPTSGGTNVKGIHESSIKALAELCRSPP